MIDADGVMDAVYHNDKARGYLKGRSYARAFNSHGYGVRHNYKKHHGRKPKPATGTDARGDDLGYLYTSWWSDYRNEGGWTKHRITKITKKRVFIYYQMYAKQMSFDRAELEANGYAFAFKRSTACNMFYTKAGIEAEDRESRQNTSTQLDVLDLTGDCTRADIMKAFRERSKVHHPDFGGNADDFRRFVEAKDRALRGLRAA